MKMDNFYYRDGNQSVGPFNRQKLIELHQKGVISDKTLVRLDSSDAWIEIEKLLLKTKIEPVIGDLDDPVDYGDKKNFSISSANAISEKPISNNTDHNNPNSSNIHLTSSETTNYENKDWDPLQPAPWRRYFARLFDLTLMGSIAWMLIGYTWYSIAPLQADEVFTNLNTLVDIVLTTLLGSIVSGIVLGAFGTTLGKSIFGIRIRTFRGEKLSISDALSRDLNVYIKGMGLGIPIVSLITMLTAYWRLRERQQMSWDKGLYSVYYRKNSGKQIALTTLGIFLYLVILIVIKALSKM